VSENAGTLIRGADGRLYLVRADGVEPVEAGATGSLPASMARLPHRPRTTEVSGDIMAISSPARSPRAASAI
jgi:hypothetical protein